METIEVIISVGLDGYNGWDMYTEWTTEEYHVKHCRGSQKMVKEDQEDSRNSCSDTLTEALQNIEMTWTDDGEISDDRSLWKSCVTRCVPSPARARGRTEV